MDQDRDGIRDGDNEDGRDGDEHNDSDRHRALEQGQNRDRTGPNLALALARAPRRDTGQHKWYIQYGYEQ